METDRQRTVIAAPTLSAPQQPMSDPNYIDLTGQVEEVYCKIGFIRPDNQPNITYEFRINEVKYGQTFSGIRTGGRALFSSESNLLELVYPEDRVHFTVNRSLVDGDFNPGGGFSYQQQQWENSVDVRSGYQIDSANAAAGSRLEKTQGRVVDFYAIDSAGIPLLKADSRPQPSYIEKGYGHVAHCTQVDGKVLTERYGEVPFFRRSLNMPCDSRDLYAVIQRGRPVSYTLYAAPPHRMRWKAIVVQYYENDIYDGDGVICEKCNGGAIIRSEGYNRVFMPKSALKLPSNMRNEWDKLHGESYPKAWLHEIFADCCGLRVKFKCVRELPDMPFDFVAIHALPIATKLA